MMTNGAFSRAMLRAMVVGSLTSAIIMSAAYDHHTQLQVTAGLLVLVEFIKHFFNSETGI